MIRQGRSFSGKERNCCFLNTHSENPDGRFANISAVSGLDMPDDGRALVHVDWDHDGDLDFLISNRNEPRLRFFRNDHPLDNRFLQLKLQGNGTSCNRNAIGARIIVQLKDSGSDAPSRLIKTLRAGEGFLSQSTQWLQFGLGGAGEVESVTVHWPDNSGTKEVFSAIDFNRRYLLVQGAGKASAMDDTARDLAIEPGPVPLPPPSSTHRVPLVYQLVAPNISYTAYDGTPKLHLTASSEYTLVNLWSTTCRPCLKELAEFSERIDELKAAGITVVGVSVDRLQNGDASSVEQAQALAERLGLKFETGMATGSLIDDLRRLHNTLIKLEKPLPLPASFLIDRKGQLDVIYKGPVTVDTLLADTANPQSELFARYERAAPFPGQTIKHDLINATLLNNQATIYFKAARELAAIGRLGEAMQAYQQVLDIAPDTPTALNDMGVLQIQMKQPQIAERYFLKAIDLNPQVDFRINLAKSIIARSKYSEALEVLNGLANDHPDHAEVHFNLGILKTRIKDKIGATVSFRKAIECSDDHSQAHFGLGNIYEQDLKITDARRHYLRAHEVDPKQPIILVSLGRVCIREQDYEAARKYLDQAVELQPNLADAHFQLGFMSAQLGHYLSAKQNLETVLNLEPNHRQARSLLEKVIRDSKN